MKKFFLGAFFASQELNVIHQKHIDTAIFLSELDGFVVADGVDQLVHELLRGHIEEPCLWSLSLNAMPDGVHQVGLSQAPLPHK